MKLINLLSLKERRFLLYTGLFLLALILFYFFVARGQIKAHSRSEEVLSLKKAELVRLKDSVFEKKKEYMRWIEAKKDIKFVNEKYFYHGKRSIHNIRRDLNTLQGKIGFEAEGIQYDYNENEESIQKITVSFSITGTYLLVKKLLFEIENLEKFIYVEKINFKDIERERGEVQLGLSLAVFYEK
jgi:Tfp pilus assembly protein PilO